MNLDLVHSPNFNVCTPTLIKTFYSLSKNFHMKETFAHFIRALV